MSWTALRNSMNCSMCPSCAMALKYLHMHFKEQQIEECIARRVSFFFPYKTNGISVYLCSSFFTPVGLTHPQVLDGLFVPVIVSVEFAQNHLELCCLENDGLAQVSDAVSCHHHGALIHQGPAADKDPGPFPKAVLLHPAGCAIDGCLPWPPRRGHCLLKGDVFCFSTD